MSRVTILWKNKKAGEVSLAGFPFKSDALIVF